MTARRRNRLPLADSDQVRDVFASGFEIEAFEDWVRVVGLADHGGNGADGAGNGTERRKCAALVVPRSAVFPLIEQLRDSVMPVPAQRRHS